MKTNLIVLIFILLGLAMKAQTTIVPFNMFLNKDKKEIFELYQKYNAMIADNPQNAQAFFERGMLKYSRNDTINAMDDLQKAVDLDPKSILYHYCYGFTLFLKGEYDATIRECDKALSYDEKFVNALNLRGSALDDLKRPEEARVNYDKALQIDPKDANTWLYYATSYYLAHDMDGLAKKLPMALKHNPDSYDGLILQELLYKHQKKYNEAIAILDKLIKTKKDLQSLYKEKAELYDSLHNQPKVCECMYNIALENFVYAHNYVMEHCPKEKEYTQMKVMALQLKAKEFSSVKNYQGAVKAYDEVIALMPDSGLNYYYRGINKNKMQDYKGAVEDYMSAIKKSPHFGTSYMLLGYYYGSTGEFEKANDYCLKSMKVDPLNPIAYYTYAELLSNNENRRQESVYYYKYAIDLNPNYREAYFGLGEVYGKLGMNGEACESFKLAEKLGDVKAISKRIWHCNQ